MVNIVFVIESGPNCPRNPLYTLLWLQGKIWHDDEMVDFPKKTFWAFNIRFPSDEKTNFSPPASI